MASSRQSVADVEAHLTGVLPSIQRTCTDHVACDHEGVVVVEAPAVGEVIHTDRHQFRGEALTVEARHPPAADGAL